MHKPENRQRGLFKPCLVFVCLLISLTGCRAGSGDIEMNTEPGTEAKQEATQEAIQKTTQEAPQKPTPQAAPSVTAAQLFQAKTPNIGDASAEGNLIGLVKEYYGITEASTFELHTSATPYGLTLHFEEKPENISVQKAAAVLMALTERCVYVFWDYPTDGAGNKEYYYLTINQAAQSAGIAHLRDFEESEADVTKLLQELETITESHAALPRSKTIEEAVSNAILEYHDYHYGWAEVYGEGHLIMGTEDVDENTIIVYALAMHGGYEFQNGNFVSATGSGCTPVVIRLSKEPDKTFAMLHYQRPMDGGEYLTSIESMFPKELWEQCLSPSDEVRNSLKKQKQAYAQRYLTEIGREAEIGDYRDFSHTIASDVGISVEVSNKMDAHRKYADGRPDRYAPYWLGTIERLENGKRYIYEHSYDPDNKEIILSEIDYDTKEVLARVVYDSETGEKK